MSLVSETVAEYTCCPGPAFRLQPDESEDIVLVPWGGDLAAGFARARSLLDQGHPVRLVGHGATLPQAWPEWVSQSSRLLLTELGAYRGGPEHPQRLMPLRREIEGWLDELFAGTLSGFPAGQVFLGSALLRIFSQYVDVYPSVRNLVECHRGARFHCTDENWIGLDLLRDLSGRDVPSRSRAGWFLRLWISGFAALAATVVEQSLRYLAEGRSRRRLRTLRQAGGSAVSPPVWAVLSPDWMRINRHVLDSVAVPRLERGEPTGILLFTHLRTGERKEHDMRAHRGSDLWPALGPLQQTLDRWPVEQIASVESPAAFLRLIVRTGLRSLRVIARAASRPPQVHRGAFQFDLSRHALALSLLATDDLCETLAAGEAAQAALARHQFRGTTVVFPASDLSPHILADLMLQNAGARTLEYQHGSVGANWTSSAPGHSSLRAVWTRADETALAPYGQPIIVAGTVRTVRPQARAARAPRNLLIASSYVHRDARLPTGYPLQIFQQEILKIVAVVKECFGERFAFRWRPHPADDEALVREALARHAGLELSRGRPLEEDVAWADILVSNLSSVVAESLAGGIPIFVHVLPHYRHAPEVASLNPARRFFHAEELRRSLPACVAALDLQDPAALEPERKTRAAWFGPSEVPLSVDEWMQQEAAAAPKRV